MLWLSDKCKNLNFLFYCFRYNLYFFFFLYYDDYLKFFKHLCNDGLMLLVLVKSLIDIKLRIIIRMAFPTKLFVSLGGHLVTRQEVNASFMFHIGTVFILF